MKKNCNNCEYLGYYDASFEEPSESGFCCDKRVIYDEKKESEFIDRLQTESYREKAKVCHEPQLSLIELICS